MCKSSRPKRSIELPVYFFRSDLPRLPARRWLGLSSWRSGGGIVACPYCLSGCEVIARKRRIDSDPHRLGANESLTRLEDDLGDDQRE